MMRHLRTDPGNTRPDGPFHVSVVAIFRNEAHVMREWLEHYLAMGVDHFYLVDNNSDDGYRAVLAPYLAAGLVELFHCEKENYQIGAYTELLPALRAHTRWIAAFDLDEFVYAPDGRRFAEVLARFAGHEAVLIPWLSFGSGGHLAQPASVVAGFVRRGPADVSRSFLKAVSRPAAIVEFCQHNPRTRRGDKVLASGAPFGDDSFIALDEERLGSFLLINNHYRLQSRSYFTRVKARRPEVHESAAGGGKQLSFFDLNDQYWNSVVDTRLRDLRAAPARPAVPAV